MFEQSLVGHPTAGQSARKLLFLPFAVTLHVALLGGFTLAQGWDVPEVDEPRLPMPALERVIPVDLPERAPEPPREPQGAAVREQAAVEPPARPPAGPVQPQIVRELTPVDPNAGEDTELETVPSGVFDPSGGGGDLPAGPTGPGGGGTPEGGDGNGIERYHVGMTKPVPISQPTPRYPTTARAARHEGTVVLEAVIDERGRVSDVQVLRGIGLGCDEAAVEAVERWRFHPATLQGRPIAVLYTLTVHFKIAR